MGAVGIGIRKEAGASAPDTRFAAPGRRVWLAGAVLILATLALYYPVHSHPFINYDDRDYVYENPPVQAGLTPSTVVWAFTSYDAGNWHPLTWLSHALDCTFSS